MVKSFKKAIAVLISVLMIATSLPFTAFAADTRDGSSLASLTLSKFDPNPVINTDVANTNNNYANLKGTYYNAVLYMQKFTGSDYHDIKTDDKTGSIYHSKNTVMMDDGTSDMLMPVMMREPGSFTWAGSNTWCFTSLYPCTAQNNTADSAEFGLKDKWRGGNGVGNLDFYYALTYADGTKKMVGHNSSTKSDGDNVGNKGVFSGSTTPYYANSLVIKRPVSYGDSNYKKYTNIYWYLNARSNNSVKTASITDKDSAIYVVNYAPMATKLDAIQAEYNGYKNSGKTYTAASLTAYENAVKAIADFNLGGYDFSQNTEDTVATAGNRIAEIMNTYNNTAKPVEYKEHVHSMSDWAVETAGTCTTPAVEERHCTATDCTDPNNAKETRNGSVDSNNHTALAANWTKTVGGTNHYKLCSACSNYVYETCDYQEVPNSAVAPTCSQAGKEADTKCTGCNDVKTGTTIEATGSHSYTVEVANSAVAPTCTVDGKYADMKCATCESVQTGAKINKLGHSFTIQQSTTTATCVTQGSVTYSCANGCSETYTEYGTIDADNHANIVTDDAVPATCTESGLTAGSHCEACEATIVAQNTVNPLGHSFTEYVSNNDATCTADGTKTATCDRDGCNAENTVTDTNSMLGHSFTNYVSNNDAVIATCVTEGMTASQTATCDRDGCEATDTIESESTGLDAENHEGTIAVDPSTVVAPTASKDGYTGDTKCSACNEVVEEGQVDPAFGDYDAYDDILIEVENLNEAAYTTESWAALQNALTGAKALADDAETQDDIDAAVEMIQTAITNLVPATDLTVTVNVQVDGSVVGTKTYTAEYGETVTIDVTDTLDGASIQKWTIEQDSATSKLSMANPVYDMVVTADATVTIIATANKQDEDPSYTKVKFIDKAVRTIGYGYVMNTNEIDLESDTPIAGSNIVAPTLAFYEFARWEKVSENVYVATYTVTESAENLYEVEAGSENIKVNGLDKYEIYYDEKINVAYTGDKMLGMEVDGKVIPITDINNVHAPYGTDEHVVKIVEIDDPITVPTSMITGKFTRPGDAGKKIAAFNAMFYLPEGYTLVECGVYAKKGESFTKEEVNTAFKVRSQTQSKNNEYTISLKSDYAELGVTEVYGMSYVTYKTADGTIDTAYSDVTVINV